MKYLLICLSFLLISPLLQAEEQVRALSFFEEPKTITAVPGKTRHLLVVMPEPGISSPVYALKGMIRYKNVKGDAFLQMDNNYGESGTFFTKSLAAEGPMGKITGGSEWRPFVLPFHSGSGDQDAASPVLEELTLSLHLPESGSVSIRDVEVYQYASGEDPLQLAMHTSGQWFSERSAGLIGGFAGALLGLWGALIGVLSSRGKARQFVLRSANALLLIGIAGIVSGVVALLTAQPYAVYFPLLLISAIIVAVTATLRGRLAAQYEQLELQRMQSMDA